MDAGLTYRRRQSYGCVDASIKPSAPDVSGFFVQPQPGGNIRITGATLVPRPRTPQVSARVAVPTGDKRGTSITGDAAGMPMLVRNASWNGARIQMR